jgi:hypothetical protein
LSRLRLVKNGIRASARQALQDRFGDRVEL